MATPRLRKFLVSVPAIAETDSAARAWDLFCQNSCEQLVVLDRQNRPVGVLRLLRLLPYLSQAAIAATLAEAKSEENESRSLLSAAKSSVPLDSGQQSLAQLRQTALANEQPFLDNLLLLPADQRVNQLQPYLTQVHQQDWGMIDANQQFVGLVDRLSLLQYLSSQPSRPPASQSRSHSHQPAAEIGCKAKARESKVRDGKPGTKTVEQRWQATGIASRHFAAEKLAGKSAIGTAPLKQTATPDPLVELLERLPIPLMLQTATGQVIAQNLAWRQQIGELRDPHQVRREAALILESADRTEPETVLTEPESADLEEVPVSPPFNSPPSSLHPTHNWEHWNAAASQISADGDDPGLCRIGTTPHACVCLCAMQNGQERVWQFMKVSMGTVSQPAIESSPWQLESPAAWLPPFKLATLCFNPDPNWYWLNQTDSLWLVLAQDITEQQQVAKELAAKNADLVQLNRLKDEFLACISHELKTPLTAVLGLSSLLKDQALGALNERQARYAQLIYQSGRHLIQIVNNILDLTRIETGQLDLLPEPVAIEEVCERAYEQACHLQMVDEHTDSALPHHPPVPFTLEIQPGLHELIADELRLRQMLTNLLSNAIKFTPLEGEIGLRVEAWEGWLAFTIWDTGIGIPSEKQHLIFQKFQQLESPMTRRFEGTGLGLVLTQRLARLHGGDVTFTSQEGRGSEFTLLLPPSPPQLMSHFRTGLGQAGNRLAIVIEADTLAVEGLTHQLVGRGYRAAIARSGTEALEKIRRLQPGIILLNPILPLLSGWDVLTLLKADAETRHIPVVITAMRVEKELAYQHGADGFLNLPIQGTALQACLDRLVEKMPPAIERSQPNLTVLYFNPGSGQQPAPLANKLHQQQCRVLEVEDLEQADLLARVWKPDVLLLDCNIADPANALYQLSQSPFLAGLPLITLTIAATEAANQIPALRVFPCLSSSWDSAEEGSHCPLNDLLQVIQMAVGMNWTPHVLIVDCSQIAAHTMQVLDCSPMSGKEAGWVDFPKLPHKPQAIAQYLQIAGLQTTVAPSWQEVLHQLQHHSVNLLLFCVSPGDAQASLSEMAKDLAQIPGKPPILMWCPQIPFLEPVSASETVSHSTEAQLLTAAGIVAEVLPDGVSISGLLDRIQQILCQPIG